MASNSPGLNSTTDLPDVSKAPRIVFLVLFMLSSFVGSLFIVIVLVHNTKLRKAQNLLIANLCVTCIIDCVFNMPLVLISLILDDWVFGTFMCKVHTFFMNLVVIQTILMLTALSIDRYLSFRYYCKYETWLSSPRICTVNVLFWLHSLIFSIPFLTEVVSSSFHPQLHLCTFTRETSRVFLCTVLLVCFIGPFIASIVFHIVTSRLICQAGYSRRADMIQKDYTQMSYEKPQTFPSSYTLYSYSASLLALWLLLEIPSVTTSFFKQYDYNEEIESGSYPWEVDTVFIWMRFFYSFLFPFITYGFKKDIWQSTKECILCRRHNSIVDMAIGKMAIDNASGENAQRFDREAVSKTKEKENESAPSLAFHVPVLYATSTGIYIEDSSVECSVDPGIHADSKFDKVGPKGKTLDITYPNCDNVDEVFGDTSDYDSSCEIDQFSSSHSGSPQNILGALHRARSMSDPEINSHSPQDISKIKDKRNDLAGTFGADSGLDLSGATTSSTGGSIRHKSKKTSHAQGHADSGAAESSFNRAPPREHNNSRARLTEQHGCESVASFLQHSLNENGPTIENECSKILNGGDSAASLHNTRHKRQKPTGESSSCYRLSTESEKTGYSENPSDQDLNRDVTNDKEGDASSDIKRENS